MWMKTRNHRDVCPAFLLHICCWARVSYLSGFLWLYSEYLLEPIVPCVFRCLKCWDLHQGKQLTLGFLKTAYNHFPEWTGPSRSLFCCGFFFSKFSRRDVCNVSLGFVFDLISSFEMLRCNMVHFWGKCKIVFPFYLCDSLTCFWNMCSKWFFILYYCFGHVALMTSVYQILSSLKCGDEELWNYSKIFVPWAQYCIINIFNGMNFIPSAYVCKY